LSVVQDKNVETEPTPDFVAWIGTAGEELNAILERQKGKKPQKARRVAKKAKKPVKKTRGFKPINRTPEELQDLPVVKGGITWAVAKKWAKKLKRDDVAQVRSELAQRKLLPKFGDK
jgi:hypothetical protein